MTIHHDDDLPMFARGIAGPLGKLDVPAKTKIDEQTHDLWRQYCALRGTDTSAVLRDTSTQSTAGKKARTAFDIPAGTSAVTLAVNPRQAAYRAGPGISVTNSAQGRRDAEMRRVMRLTRI